MSDITRSADQERRRRIRDVGCYRDPLPLNKLKELKALWEDRMRKGEYLHETCAKMIRLYEIRIARLGG